MLIDQKHNGIAGQNPNQIRPQPHIESFYAVVFVDVFNQFTQAAALSPLVLHDSAYHNVWVGSDAGSYWVNLILLLAAIEARSTCQDLMLA